MALIKHISQIDLEKILVRSIENTYKAALKKTEVLEEGKAPFYSCIPIINRIGGYHDPIRYFENAMDIAIDIRSNMRDTLDELYKLRGDTLESIAIEKSKFIKLEEDYQEIRLEETTEETATEIKTVKMKKEDELTEQGNKIEALESSMALLDVVTACYKGLFGIFSKRAEMAENAKIISAIRLRVKG